MFHPVYPIHRRPLVVRTGVDYRFTALVVDQVDAVDGRYEVLFLGTGETGSGQEGSCLARNGLEHHFSHFQIEAPSRKSSFCQKIQRAWRS